MATKEVLECTLWNFIWQKV